MVVYYIKKAGESLADYRYPIKEGDICMLYDGDVVKTVYIDSEIDSDSIWRDYKFVDTKSLKSYQFPTSDCILCAPTGDRHAIGNVGLLTQLIKECKGEWLLDYLNETSAVLSGFVDYWDLGILRRFTGDDDVEVTYVKEETLSEFLEKPDDQEDDDEYDEEEEVDDTDFLPKSYDIKWFCLSALTCIEDQLDKRSYQILADTLKGDSRSEIADRHRLTQERIRQIVVKTTKQAKELLIEQRKSLDETKAENAKLKVQLNLLREDIAGLKTLLPREAFDGNNNGNENLDSALVGLLETPISDICLSIRAINVLKSMAIEKFSDIPQIGSSLQLLKVRNSGKKTVHDVTRMLKDFHLTFGMSLTEVIDVLQKDYGWYAVKKKWMEKHVDKGEHDNQGNVNQATRKAISLLAHTKNMNEKKEIAKSEETTITLTSDIIEAARTPNGGFTKSQLAALGIAWPPPKDWIEEKVGTMITPTQLENFNRIEYVPKTLTQAILGKGSITYKDIAFSSDDRRKMEAILQAMTHFYSPATPQDIARTISRGEWGEGVVNEDTVDSILKRLPEVEYIKWGKYILKARIKGNQGPVL